MAVRQIKYTVYADRLEPSVKQFGGMQGDHKATEVLFEISDSLYKILKEQAESTNGRLIYRFDGYDGAGGVHSSDTTDLPEEDGEELLVMLRYPLEEWITRYGGQIKVVLVISLIKDDLTEMELYNYPAVIQLKNLPTGATVPGENHESISTLAQVAKESAEIAAKAKEEAVAAQIKAEENAEEVIGRIEPLEADMETLKGTYVDTQHFEETSQGLEKRITYAESDIIDLQEDIVIIKEDYATKKYVDDAVASGGVSQEYVDNAIDSLADDVAYLSTHAATKQYVDDAVAANGGVSQEYVDNAIGALEDDIGYIHEHYATKQYVDDAVASSGGGVSSWNDLTDKPFYDEGTKTATLDYANPPAASFDFGDIFFGKVTDDLLTSDHLNGAKVSLSFTYNDVVTDVSQELSSDTLQAVLLPFGTVYQFNGEEFLFMIVVATQTGEFDVSGDGSLLTITETGTYLGFTHYNGGTQNSVSLEYNLIKTLEAKYLEIVSTTADTSVLAEQELSFTDDGNGMYQAMLGAIPLTAGNEYKVLWDGTEYVYEAMNMDGMIILGDVMALNPFGIANIEGGTQIATSSTSATHTVAITEVGGYEIKQEYLPASLYTEIDQRIEESIGDIETALGGI